MTECTRCHQDRGYSRICVHCITEILADHDDHLFRLQAKLAAAEARAERLAIAGRAFVEAWEKSHQLEKTDIAYRLMIEALADDKEGE